MMKILSFGKGFSNSLERVVTCNFILDRSKFITPIKDNNYYI